METTEELLVNLLIEKGYHISFAESITGGMCASKLINVSNASKVLNESYVTYSNEAKIKLLNVSKETIDTYGVVSEDVAYQMAKGVALATNSEIGVGITGVAGPTSYDNVLVGTVCFGIYINGDISTLTINFNDIGRNKVRKSATEFIFEELLKVLSKWKKEHF